MPRAFDRPERSSEPVTKVRLCRHKAHRYPAPEASIPVTPRLPTISVGLFDFQFTKSMDSFKRAIAPRALISMVAGFHHGAGARRVLVMKTRTFELPGQSTMDVLALYRYRVVRTDGGRLFAFGFDRATAHVRIVELEAFDEAELSGVTTEGARLQLDGHPALDMDAGALWASYRAEHELGGYVDVTP